MDDETVIANSDAILPDRLRIGNEQAARTLSADAAPSGDRSASRHGVAPR